MGPCLSHQEIEEISHDHTEEFLNRSGNERRTELEEKEVNKPVKRLGVTFFHINPIASLDSSFEIVEGLTIDGKTLNECRSLDQINGGI
jgi:hypothetical protein